jgi:CheY-like chemotaxis protein
MSVPVQPLTTDIVDGETVHSGSILIVEDNPVNAKVLERMVLKLGYRVDIVNSGDEALKRLTDNVYSLIFMDIQMPVMDGITATRWIRRRGINTPIVAISCNSELDVRRRCMEHGVNDFLVKPASRSDVFRVLERQISSA